MIPDLVAAVYADKVGSAVIVIGALSAIVLLGISTIVAFRRQAKASKWAELQAKRARESEERERHRSDNLAKILEISNRINATLELESLLNEIARAVSESLGFRMALLRILDEESGTFVARAFAGLSQEAIEKLSSRRIPLETFKTWMKDEFRISRSYFISHKVGFWNDREDEVYVPDLGERGEDEWHPMDSLFVPLWTRDQRLVGYLSVDDPVDRKIPTLDTIETLEIFANQAVTAIENARLYSRLEENVAQLREMTKRLKELNEMKTNFVAAVSHELRTPLTSIMAYAETLARDWGETPRQVRIEFLKIIQEEAQRLTKIVEDMLDLSKLESGKVDIKKTDRDLCKIIEDVKQVLTPTAKKKSISIETSLPDDHVKAFVDGSMIKQLLVNLAGNAIKFTPEGGRVEITLADRDSTVEISVEDTGIGIPPESIDRIFDEFYQVDSSATRKYGGAGLGLAIVRNIVEWHDGKIWVESESGKGTRFTVSLPKRKAVAPARPETGPDEPTTCERRVSELIVDMIAEIMGAKTASLMLLNEENRELYVSAAMGLDEAVIRNARVKVGNGIAGWVAETGRPVLVHDIEADERFAPSRRPQYETKSLVSVPLKQGDRVIGVVNVTNRITLTPFTKNDADILQILADRISGVLGKVRQYESVKSEFAAITNSLKCLIESRRLAHARKSEMVGRLVVELGRAMGLGEEEVRMLQYVSQIYDVGMVRVGEEILRKRGGLGVVEYESVKRHPEAGVDIVGPIEFLEQVKEIILHHHERYDGGGYPGGLRGEEIPLGARVLAVVDAYSSMVSERPYRRAMSMEEAVEELRRCSGSQFDPQVVDKFINILKAGMRQEQHVVNSLVRR